MIYSYDKVYLRIAQRVLGEMLIIGFLQNLHTVSVFQKETHL